jgi:hypothetical protein
LRNIFAGEETDTALVLAAFTTEWSNRLTSLGESHEVAGFKSIACYRTGLDVSTGTVLDNDLYVLVDIDLIRDSYITTKKIRLAHKFFNDHILCIALSVAAKCKKPGVFRSLQFFHLVRF